MTFFLKGNMKKTKKIIPNCPIDGQKFIPGLVNPTSETTENLRNRNVELEKQIVRGGEELALRTAELSERTGELNERTAELGERTEQLGKRTGQLGVRTAELGERTEQLGERTGELGERTAELGKRTGQLGDRTKQLNIKTKDFDRAEALNKELEAFTYAASHDLRAPLRSIDGFSLALLEDYNDKLDAEGQDHLKRIRECAQTMGQLIDDLIGLSSLTRASLKRVEVDLAVEGQKIAAELKRTSSDRKVTFKFTEKLMADCDLNLIRIVLQNLLGNAYKYTAKRQDATIDMGSLKSDGQVVYFVRDDGTGFDMKYAHKLFRPFQRLHDSTEFSGNGIGLATVQRVVNRHGGQVWAEAEMDKGTTIFFTL